MLLGFIFTTHCMQCQLLLCITIVNRYKSL